MHAWICALMLGIAGAEPAAAATPGIAPPAADVALVCPPALLGAIDPWVKYRQAQGHIVALVRGEAEPVAIRAALKVLHAANPKLSVVLLGDATPNPSDGTVAKLHATDHFCVPTHLAKAQVNIVFGSEPEIATDNWYADFDDDGVPEAAVGRLPVDSADELRAITERIIRYERSSNLSAWRRRINLVAGIGGFGAVADTAIEAAAKTLLTRHLPPSYETTLTQAGWQSPYCPGPPQFRNTVIRRFNEGCLLWVYIGHGWRDEVDRLNAPDGQYSILSTRDVPTLQADAHPPLAVFLSCYSGAFDGPQDCLAETMLRKEGGPIGVLCGSRVTMPYAMSILGQELMTSFFQDRATTIGQAMRDAKRALALKPRTSEQDQQFDALAKALMPMAADLKAQRDEHLHLFNLLGDPLLRLPQPEAVEVTAPAEVRAGEEFVMTTTSPIAGRATIEFVVRRDRLKTPPADRTTYDITAFGMQNYAEAYAEANDTRLAGETVEISAGRLERRILVPTRIKGDCHVRVYVEGAKAYAMGSADLRVLPAVRTKSKAGT